MINSKIIKAMYDNRKINNGQPIVSVVFNDTFIIKEIESNKKRTSNIGWNEMHLIHAEWLSINKLENNGINLKLNIIITTSPCLECAKRIEESRMFKNVYFLFDKFNPTNDDLYWKNIPYIKKIDWKKHFKLSKKTIDQIEIMYNHWTISNIQNSEKSINKKL